MTVVSYKGIVLHKFLEIIFEKKIVISLYLRSANLIQNIFMPIFCPCRAEEKKKRSDVNKSY